MYIDAGDEDNSFTFGFPALVAVMDGVFERFLCRPAQSSLSFCLNI
jgi:hypothetical protein